MSGNLIPPADHSETASTSVYYSDETGTLRDAEAITVFLQGYLKPGDRVLASVPSDAPLIYYFDLYGVSHAYLATDLSASRRIVVVVNVSDSQTLEGVLSRAKLSRAPFNDARVVRGYDTAILYQMDRRS